MLFSRYPVYLESIGFMAVFTEAMLGIPQFIRNFKNQSTEGMRFVRILTCRDTTPCACVLVINHWHNTQLYFCTKFATFVPPHASFPAVSSWWPVGAVVTPSRQSTSLCDLLQFSLQFVDRFKLLLISWSLLKSATTEVAQTGHLYQLQGSLVVNLSSFSYTVDFYFLWSFIII